MIFDLLRKIGPGKPGGLSCYGRTDPGMVRSHNEDSFCSLRNRGLFIVADGMGGHRAGEVASRLAIESVLEFLSAEKLREIRGHDQEIRRSMLAAFAYADQAVTARAAADAAMLGMGCTMVVCLLDGNRLHTCHVGDARCYLLEKGRLRQLTTDHTSLTYSHQADADNNGSRLPRQVVTRAIGFLSREEAEYHRHMLRRGSRVLLCSDGLWNMLDHARIEQLLLNSSTPEEAGEALVTAANEQGGRDNITALVIFP